MYPMISREAPYHKSYVKQPEIHIKRQRIMAAKIETKEFQAEVKKMLDIVINSLYTEKEVFLRES